MTEERRKFEELHDLLDRVVTAMVSEHTKPNDFGTGVPLYRSEIHTIQMIGENSRINVTRLADRLNVTKGAVSQTVSKLVTKGLAKRSRDRRNAKEVLLELTDLGWTGFDHHERFHLRLYSLCKDHFGETFQAKLESITEALRDLDGIMQEVTGRANAGRVHPSTRSVPKSSLEEHCDD